MSPRPAVSIELDSVFEAEARHRYGDVEAAVREALPWVVIRLAAASDLDQLAADLNEQDPEQAVFRALIGCAVLGRANSRPDVRRFLCDHLAGRDLSDGARYQLAGAFSRLGVEARRRSDLDGAVEYSRKGLDAIEDLPPRGVTANLYYNLGVALELRANVTGAVEAYEQAADIDDSIGRPVEAVQSRQRIEALRGS